jgi:ubiquinone/menaquinone biosynthesis C-methylase UbiE
MQEKEQEYAKQTFADIANTYDKIAFFKTSAKHMLDIITKHTNKRDIQMLDVACGTGNVVLECASFMPESMFDAIDISEGMLAKAKENASKRNLENITFQCKDISKLASDKKYNVVTCAYALFFLPNPIKVLASLTKLLKPRGIIIFTSFTTEAFSPSSEILIALLQKYGSSTAKAYDANKWENLKTIKDIDRLCMMSYVSDMQIQTEQIRYGMSVDEWWELHNNTGYKGMLMELSTEDYETVKSEYYEAMLKHADMDGEVELIADSYFVTTKG